jgi:hypothetical protein
VADTDEAGASRSARGLAVGVKHINGIIVVKPDIVASDMWAGAIARPIGRSVWKSINELAWDSPVLRDNVQR